MAHKKVQKLTILMGNFSTPENCLQKIVCTLPCLLDSVLRRRMNSNVVNRIIFSSRCHHHWNSNFLFECQHLPENIKQNIKIGNSRLFRFCFDFNDKSKRSSKLWRENFPQFWKKFFEDPELQNITNIIWKNIFSY